MRALQGGRNNGAVLAGQVHCRHQTRGALRLNGRKVFSSFQGQSLVPAANDLLLGGFAAGLVIANAKTGHIDAHVGGRLVGGSSHDLFQEATQNREGLDIAVVVDRGFTVSLQVEVVDHIDVVQVHGCRLVGDVHRVIQGEVPDREGFELRVSRGQSALVIMVELREAGCELAGSRSGSGDNHQRASRMNVFVTAQPLIGDNEVNIVRVALDGIVACDVDSTGFKLAFEGVCLLIRVAPTSNDNVADVEPVFAEHIDVAEDVVFVGDSQVFTHLAALEVQCVNGDDNFGLFSKLSQHDDLVVGGEAREHAGSVHIVDEFPAEL